MNRREFLQRSLIASAILGAEVAACDPLRADIRVVDSSDRSGTSSSVPLLAGQTVTRRYTIFNGTSLSARLQVRVQPKLRPRPDKAAPIPAILRTVSVPANGHAVLPVEIALPTVPVNTLLDLTVSVVQDGGVCCKRTDSLLLIPAGKGGTQAIFLDRDDRTKGNWRGAYGKEAFFLPVRVGITTFSSGAVYVDRGLEYERLVYIAEHGPHDSLDEIGAGQKAFEELDKAAHVDDVRIPFGGNGLTTRDPIAFSTQPIPHRDPKSHASRMDYTPILVRVDSKDDKPHRLSLYFVDYKRQGRPMEVALYDRQGHKLVSQRLANYGEGAYLRFRFSGSVIALITPLTNTNPTLSGAFIDPDTGEGLLKRS